MTLVSWGQTVQWGTAQSGVWTTNAVADGFFVQVGLPAPTPQVLIGAVVQAPGVHFQAGRVVDPPSVGTITFQVPWLAMIGFPSGVHLFTTVRLWVVPQVAAADFDSGANFPLTRGEILLGTFVVPEQSGAVTTLVPLTVSSGDALAQLRAQVIGRTTWQGKLAFVVEHVVGVGDPFFVSNGPSALMALQAEQVRFFAGLVGGPGGRVRAVQDHRYGFPAFNHELVRDGDQPGLFVRPWDVDPEDEPATYRPKPGEGSVDDEVGNL